MQRYSYAIIGALAVSLALLAHAKADEAPPQEAPQGIGWVYAPYTSCVAPNPDCFVNVAVDGLNVRQWPNGPPIVALVNGTPIHVLSVDGWWLYVGASCPLVPTGVWSDTAGVQLAVCQQ